MMKNDILFASIAIMVVLIALGAFFISPALGNPSIVSREAPLYKNTYFQLAPGQTYIYSVTMSNNTANATYRIGEGDGCTLVRLMESVNFSGACLDRFGMDDAGFNSSVGKPPILMFQPWMLALKDGWTWNSTMYLSFDGRLKRVSQSSYRVIRLENYSGRQAYVVELKTDGSTDYEWVDAERRILLKMTGQGYEIDLKEDGG